MSHHFELEDAPDYLAHFPVLVGKAQLGRGEFSIVFESDHPDTVLKLTCDAATVNFLMMGHPHVKEGLVEVVKYHGDMPCCEHGQVFLIELKRLHRIEPDTHRDLYYERESVMAAIRHRIIQSDRLEGVVDAQQRYAGAIQELALSRLFSSNINKALVWIATFLRSSPLDLLHDLCNPDNYMTDGTRLIITDPLICVPAD
ncbi:MAG: hypothetical protein RR740_00490 [Pseudomonas sp.]